MSLDEYLKKIQKNEAVGAFAIENPYSSEKNWSDKYLKRKKKVIEEEIQNFGLRRLLIDFDNTIHKYSKGFLDGSIYDVPIEGSKQALDELKSKGYEIVIFTCRASRANRLSDDEVDEQIGMIEDWMDKYQIPYDRITGQKLESDAIIDDKALRFTGDWNQILQRLIEIENKTV